MATIFRIRRRCWLVIVVCVVTAGALAWRWTNRLHWIEGDLAKGLAVARRGNRKVLLLLTGDW